MQDHSFPVVRDSISLHFQNHEVLAGEFFHIYYLLDQIIWNVQKCKFAQMFDAFNTLDLIVV